MGQLILVRHGQASFGAADYDVLSETGWAQGRALGTWLRDAGTTPTALISGGLRRHRETLEAMREAAGWTGPAVTVDAGWDEFDHLGIVATHPDLPPGDLDRRDFQKAFERATAAWTAGSHTGDFESYADFLARVRASLARAVSAAGSGETVIVVSSGGPIAAVCADLVSPEAAERGGGGEDGAQAATGRVWTRFNTVAVNAAMTRVVVGATGPRLLTFNEHAHVVGELLTYR